MMWKELFLDLKERILKYNEKMRSQKIRSISRMVNAVFWFFFFFVTGLASDNSDGLATICIVACILFSIRYIHILYAYCNKNELLYLRFIFMALIEFILLITTYRLAALIFIPSAIVILIAFPFVFSINIKNS